MGSSKDFSLNMDLNTNKSTVTSHVGVLACGSYMPCGTVPSKPSGARLPLRPPASACVHLVLDPRKAVAVVLLAPLLWLGWPCAAPPPPLLRALTPIPFRVGVICDFLFFFWLLDALFPATRCLQTSGDCLDQPF